MAYWVNKSYFLRSFLSMNPSGLKFFTSQANWVLNLEASNFVIGPAPDFPRTIFCQNSATEFPRGVITPNPVMTTLLWFCFFDIDYCFNSYEDAVVSSGSA